MSAHHSRRTITLYGAIMVTGALLPGTYGTDASVLAALAACAVLTAAMERRSADMILAAAIAIGLAPLGLVTLPLAIGVVIRQRAARLLPLGATVAAGAWLLPGNWKAETTWSIMATLTSTVPDIEVLAAATGLGLAAWVAAAASVKGTSLRAPMIGTVMLVAFMPITPVALVAPLIVMIGWMRTARPWPRAANDNPFLPRAHVLA